MATTPLTDQSAPAFHKTLASQSQLGNLPNNAQQKMTSSAPSPKSILRGHKSQVHAAVFVRSNERLVTGDANGFVVVWDLTVMRAKAVWRAHEKAILGIRGWRHDRIIT